MTSAAQSADPAQTIPAAQTWPDDRFHRVAALALIEGLRSDLLSQDSATLVLERWCMLHRLAPVARLVAERAPGPDRPLDAKDRALLGVGPEEPVRYRHVRLTCGGRLLSEADNWYVPSRLTPAMNRLLDSTDVPFGRVVRPLGFQRTTLSSRLLWSPLAPGWAETRGEPARGATRSLTIPDALIENRAILRRAGGDAFSLVVETYRDGLFAFPAPAA